MKPFVSENNTSTQQEMANYLSKETGQSISQQAVSRLLRKDGITYKKLTHHYIEMNEEKVKEFNNEIRPLLREFPFIALDECSFYPKLDPKFGYSIKGERAISQKPSNQGKHYTLLLAISNSKVNGVVHWKLIEGGADWKTFYDFLEEIKPIGNRKNILLMDNAKIHTAPKKRAEAKLSSVTEQMAKKNIEVRYLVVPYAPILNPAELCFNTIKQRTNRKKSRSYERMELLIKEAIELLNKQDLSKNFWHCVNYFDKKVNI